MTATRPMQRDDLFQFQWLQRAKLSPDGTKIIYVVTHIAGEDDQQKEYATIYLYDRVSRQTRQMTSGKQVDTHPVWSPDGKHIAFTSDRSDKTQIYQLPIDGGEAQALTDLKQGAGAPHWSPDGKHIAFTAGLDYGDDDAPDRNKTPYRIDRHIWRFDAIGDLQLAVNNLYTVALESQTVQQLTNNQHTMITEFAWSPDSQRLFYSEGMLPDRWFGFECHQYLIDLEGEVLQHFDDMAYFHSVNWLDNQRVLLIGPVDENAIIGTHSDLWIVNLETGTRENRSDGLEMNFLGGLEGRHASMVGFSSFIAYDDRDQSAYLHAQVGGEVAIYKLALTGDIAIEAVIDGERACYLLDHSQDDLLFAASDINHPHDLYIAQTDGQHEQQLTQLNAALMSQLTLPDYEHLQFAGTDGTEVEGWYVKPTNSTQAPYPTILWIHGGPHSAQGHVFAFDTHLLAGAGYGVLFINHRASSGYGNAFATGIHGDWGVLDYGDLMAGVDAAIARGLADADRLGCCGISGGGNLSAWIIGNTTRFKAAIPQNPVTNWQSFYGVSDVGVWFATRELGGHPHEIPDVYRRCSPLTYAHQCTTPTLMIQCEHDWRCPPEQSEQFYTVLRANGCTVQMLRQPGGSHGGSVRGALPLRQANLKAKLEWFNQYILGIEPETEAESAESAADEG